MTLSEFKAAAQERGIEWQACKSIYDAMRAEELAFYDRRRGMIGDAFRMLGERHGGRFKIAHRHEFSGGDHATIAGFDEVAAHLANLYPELLSADDCAGELWALLTEPAEPAPAAADTMARALERAESEAPAVPGSPRDMISTAEAALLANVSEQWIRKLVKSGKLYGRQVGKSYVVSAAAAARFKRHPTAGRPRVSAADLSSFSDVPF